ncbi:MAG TPA: response regulator [Acidimicrobiia bacterium]|nr:response regulator [Acidimicrobiia bacterium]
MSDHTILVIEDEAALRRALRIFLDAHGYGVVLAATGREGLELAAREHPDVVILDLGLPDMDGVQVATELRSWSRVPIVVLSARDAEASKVAALDAGADDYVTKPFGMNEFLARLRAALRRAAPTEQERIVVTPDFTIDLGAKQVGRDGESVHLTPTEWQIVEVLVRNKGKLVAQQRLLQSVWGPQYERETHYLRIYMSQIRRKLEPDPSRPRYFITEPGMGYRFVVEEK